MAIAPVNMSYIGQGPKSGQQIIADQTSGPRAKTLVGFGTAIGDGASSSFTANFIDGVNTMGKLILLPLQSVLASVPYVGAVAAAGQTFTLTAVAAASGGTTVYTGTITGGTTNNYVGYVVTIAGFVSPANNGIFTVTANTSTTITVNNPNGVAVTAAGTAATGVAAYQSTSADSSVAVGDTVIIAGFTTGANNGTFTVYSVNSTQVILNNGVAVAESNPAATLKDVQNAIPFTVFIGRDGNATDTAAVTNTVTPSAVTSTGFTVNTLAVAAAGASLSFVAYINLGV